MRTCLVWIVELVENFCETCWNCTTRVFNEPSSQESLRNRMECVIFAVNAPIIRFNLSCKKFHVEKKIQSLILTSLNSMSKCPMEKGGDTWEMEASGQRSLSLAWATWDRVSELQMRTTARKQTTTVVNAVSQQSQHQKTRSQLLVFFPLV